ncbi:MAG: phage tail tip lysozyme [Gallionella sp.]|nr:phage tail tip lysozyme [Gallionella sp.]MDD4958384.1 phage tail tip lysozyme [Gallionella sp.]
MAGDPIKEFLVAIGYDYQVHEERKVLRGISHIHHGLLKLAEIAELASATFVYGMAKMAASMEQLALVSARTNSLVTNIQATAFATAQLGGNADQARASLDNLAKFMRSSPGAPGLIQSITGMPTTQADGKPVAATTIMSELMTSFKKMPFYRAQAYASMITGMDQNTLIAMMNNGGAFSKEYKQTASSIGVTQQDFENARNYMIQFRNLEMTIELLTQKIISVLAGPMAVAVNQFRLMLIGNSKSIVSGLKLFAELLGTVALTSVVMFTQLIKLVADLSQWFEGLNSGTRSFLETLALIGAAIWAFQAKLLMSPFGLFIAGLTAILLLMQDYEVYTEGGKSLIDWSKWEPDLRKVSAWFKDILQAVAEFSNRIGGISAVIQGVADTFTGLVIYKVLIKLIGTTKAVVKSVGVMRGAFAAFGDFLGADWLTAILVPLTIISARLLGIVGLIAVVAATAGPMALKDLPAKSPLWKGVPVDEQKKYPNSPYNQARVAHTGNGSLWNPANWAPRFDTVWRRTKAVQEMKRLGYTKAQRAALMSQIDTEDPAYDPSQREIGGGPGRGLFQWGTARQAQFKKLYGHSVAQGTVKEQIDFMNWELHHTYASVGRAFAAAKNRPGKGSEILTRGYELPAHPNLQSLVRKIDAQHIYAGMMGMASGGHKQITVKTDVNLHGVHNPEAASKAVTKAQKYAAQLVSRDLLGSGSM